MNRKNFLQGPCGQCGGRIEYPAEMIGTMMQCPHCGGQTELRLAVPEQDSGIPRRVIIGVTIAVLILVLGLAGALTALKLAQHWSATHKANTTNAVSRPH